ncbi:hypothetical protein PC116_g5050 [Phytophthora cactorum]|nr:hypothetical protein PC116_g5050 [Phytophthora cactorum]
MDLNAQTRLVSRLWTSLQAPPGKTQQESRLHQRLFFFSSNQIRWNRTRAEN